VVRDRRNVDRIAHPAISAYLTAQQDVIFGGVPSDPGHSFLTARSLEAMSNLFDLCLRLPVSDESGAMSPLKSYSDSFVARYDDDNDGPRRWTLFQALAGATVGPDNVAQFLGTLELFDEIPSVSAILTDPGRAKVSDKADAQFLVANIVANAMNPGNAAKLMAYLKRLRPSNYHNAVVAASTRDGALMLQRDVAQFYRDHPDSMARMLVMQGRAGMARRTR
jgi:hypothetical protein